MLELSVPDLHLFNETDMTFIDAKGCTLKLEHSLVSISKWEAKYHKPFLDDKHEKTKEETIDYIRFMTVSPAVVDDTLYQNLPVHCMQEIEAYIADPMTATWFSEDGEKQTSHKKTITSELIYYWMIQLQIPVEFQKWHLNRLLTLIRVCNVENAPPKKMTKSEIFKSNKARNEARRAKYNSKG